MSPEEVARATGRSADLVRRWVRQGRIPAQRVGRHVVLGPDALDAVASMPRVNRRRPQVAA